MILHLGETTLGGPNLGVNSFDKVKSYQKVGVDNHL